MNNQNIKESKVLPTPTSIIGKHPLSATMECQVATARTTVEDILQGRDPRHLAVVGPCSIHNVEEAYDYAKGLKKIQDNVADIFFIIMRVYCEKPRTTVGWKGLAYDPDLNETNDIEKGLTQTRELLKKINALGLPCACEFLDTIMPQYFADLVAWGAIGARTTESQLHRQLVSGLSMPVGFKNSTSGSVKCALCSVKSSSAPHTFPGITVDGRPAIFKTTGNPNAHVVLRGGEGITHYDRASIQAIKSENPDVPIVVDCSHGNSLKDHTRQPGVLLDIVDNSMDLVRGIMIESNLAEGSQQLRPRKRLRRGVSITDSCISLEQTEALFEEACERIRKLRVSTPV
jgi:3-deoxy-7-phosphoheptulonate synthase